MKKLISLCVIATMMLLFIQIEQAHATGFKDVSTTNTLKTEIDYLVSQKVIEGYPDGSFRPNDHVTRAQVAVLLTRALKLDTKNVKNPYYQDVPQTHHNYKEIAAAQNAGIFIKAEKFNPNGKMTRGNMAIVLQRAFDLKTIEGQSIKFQDVHSKMSNYQSIMAVAHNNITRGYKMPGGIHEKIFKPTELLTRAHFSAFLARALTLTSPNVLKDKNYVYTYRYQSDSNKQPLTLNYNYIGLTGNYDTWQVKNLTNSLSFANERLHQNQYFYGEGSQYHMHHELGLSMPIRIGVVHHENDEGPVSGYRVTVKDTQATVTVNGVTYKNVLIVEKMIVGDKSYSKTYYYYAPNIGLIKKIDQREKTVLELMKRTAR